MNLLWDARLAASQIVFGRSMSGPSPEFACNIFQKLSSEQWIDPLLQQDINAKLMHSPSELARGEH